MAFRFGSNEYQLRAFSIVFVPFRPKCSSIVESPCIDTHYYYYYLSIAVQWVRVPRLLYDRPHFMPHPLHTHKPSLSIFSILFNIHVFEFVELRLRMRWKSRILYYFAANETDREEKKSIMLSFTVCALRDVYMRGINCSYKIYSMRG